MNGSAAKASKPRGRMSIQDRALKALVRKTMKKREETWRRHMAGDSIQAAAAERHE